MITTEDLLNGLVNCPNIKNTKSYLTNLYMRMCKLYIDSTLPEDIEQLDKYRSIVFAELSKFY